jgi:prolyl oligopeptidase
LAVTGVSNGGLTAAVAAVQRPDLWAVAVPRVPRLDLIGACRFPYGRQSTLEDRVSSLEDPDEVRRLATFSPYHLVREGMRCPALYLDAGATDPRCPPWDARKFAARLQAIASLERPVLLHVWEKVGHGWATGRDIAAIQNSEWLAFILRHLGMSVPPP